MNPAQPYVAGFLDWLACAARGRDEPAARAAAAASSGNVGDRVIALATAGHVLDFDDTYAPGLAHLSAPTAPAALVVGVAVDATVGDVLAAYAAGFEAMGAVAQASHPALYERGWHPTAVCGVVGAATAAAVLRRLDEDLRATACRIALLSAAGVRAVFGSDGKAVQVGLAAAAGARAAVLATAGTTIPPRLVEPDATDGFTAAYGGRWAEPHPGRPAVAENWIKAYPCCLQTHAAIEAAARVGGALDKAVVTVHPVSRQAAPLDDVTTGLQAKFSIPYTVAFTALHGPPGVDDFHAVDPDARALAARVRVETDASLGESEAVLESGGESVRVPAALRSPPRPMTAAQLGQKVRTLTGDRLDGALDDLGRPARDLLALTRPRGL